MEAIKASVIPVGGLRGGRPRKDGLIPGSEAAIRADRAKDAAYQAEKRKERSAARAAVPPLPRSDPPADGKMPDAAPVAGVAAVPILEDAGWLAADAQPLVESLVIAGEAWDEWDNKKILAPLELDAASTSRILSGTRWPDKPKLAVIKTLPGPTAKLCNLIHLPKAVKDYVEGIPALALLAQTIAENKRNLRKIVEEELARKGKAIAKEEKK